jgi:hydroxymethylglutaryl-CoA lyase
MIRYPASVRVAEVGPRDGLQSFHRWVDTETKIKLVDRLSDAKFPIIEMVGFAHPRFIPNLKDAEEVVARTKRVEGVTYRALVPNLKGAERALQCGRLDELVGLSTASVSYTRKNQNMTPEDAIEQGILSFRAADKAGLGFVMAIGMAFWCPFDGLIDEEYVLGLMAKLHNAGVRSYNLAGSMGMEDPRHVGSLFGKAMDRFPGITLGYHIHNMSGMIPASILAAMDAGATAFEGSICGIGGGVATPHAVGNLPSEDIVQMFNDAGVPCGVDTEEAIAAARDCAKLLDIEVQSSATRYGSRREQLSRH